MRSASLISLGQLADDGCTTKVKKKDLIVKKDGNIILTGKIHFRDGLYDIPIYGTHPNLKINIIADNYILPKIKCLSQNSIFASSSITPKILKKKLSLPLLPTFKRNPFHMNHILNKRLTSILRENTYGDR